VDERSEQLAWYKPKRFFKKDLSFHILTMSSFRYLHS